MGLRRLITVPLACAAVLAACGRDDGAATATGTGTAARPASAAPPPGKAAGTLALQRVGTFQSPVFVTAPRGDRRRLFVVEQGGVIRVVRGGKRLGRPFLDLRSRIKSGGEQGLLGLAFAPDYARTRRFYVDYTDRNGNTRIVEFRRSRASADRADAGSARQVLFQAQPESNHNGGWIAFGPDRLLYVAFGDGGGGGDQHGERGNGQDLSTRLGKLLRIDPRRSGSRRYRVPPGNPFVKRSGARPEIWAYGLRNPWRDSFDRRTGDLVIADVGQDTVEEVDFAAAGSGGGRGVNYGWRVFEGSRRFTQGSAPGHVAPVLEHLHSDGWCSITGGYVVRDPGLPSLAGRYVYGDFCKGQIRSARLRTGRATGDRATGLHVESLSSFGEDARARVYAVSLAGPVFRIVER